MRNKQKSGKKSPGPIQHSQSINQSISTVSSEDCTLKLNSSSGSNMEARFLVLFTTFLAAGTFWLIRGHGSEFSVSPVTIFRIVGEGVSNWPKMERMTLAFPEGSLMLSILPVARLPQFNIPGGPAALSSDGMRFRDAAIGVWSCTLVVGRTLLAFLGGTTLEGSASERVLPELEKASGEKRRSRGAGLKIRTTMNKEQLIALWGKQIKKSKFLSERPNWRFVQQMSQKNEIQPESRIR